MVGVEENAGIFVVGGTADFLRPEGDALGVEFDQEDILVFVGLEGRDGVVVEGGFVLEGSCEIECAVVVDGEAIGLIVFFSSASVDPLDAPVGRRHLEPEGICCTVGSDGSSVDLEGLLKRACDVEVPLWVEADGFGGVITDATEAFGPDGLLIGCELDHKSIASTCCVESVGSEVSDKAADQ